MADLPLHNLQTHWAATFIQECYDAGLRHAVISPGSRSTPLTLACATHPGITTHVVVDERSAGFFAVGLSRGEGVPAALVCTSGTAVANYFPAVVEARMSETPLLVLTADRPPMHRDIGASQAIDQHHIFGRYPRFFFDTGEPRSEEPDLKHLAFLARQAWLQASGDQGGPVHINFPFRKPLEPDGAFIRSLPDWYGSKGGNQAPVSVQKPDVVSRQVVTVGGSIRPVILAGPHHTKTGYGNLIRSLNERYQIPVFAEPGAYDGTFTQSKRCSTEAFFRFLVRNPALQPDLILRFGFYPVSRAANQLLESGVRQIHFFNGERFQNPSSSPVSIIRESPETLDIVFAGSVEQHWLEAIRKTVQTLREGIRTLVTDYPAFTDLHVYETALPAFPDADIMVSNSYPIRDLDCMLPDSGKRRIHTNRGASGIDGITSTAIGTGTTSNKDVLLFTGDLAFFHDLNALSLAGELSHRLIVFIVNNNGGTIFRMLPTGELGDLYTPYFETPLTLDFMKLCEGFAVHAQRATSVHDLAACIASVPEKPGLYVIECKTQADASELLRQKIRQL